MPLIPIVALGSERRLVRGMRRAGAQSASQAIVLAILLPVIAALYLLDRW